MSDDQKKNRASMMTSTVVDLVKMPEINNDIVSVGGNKGGVGKSFVARFEADAHIEDGRKPTILEADGGNPDVAKFYGLEESFNLNSPEGFGDLFARLESSDQNQPALISLPAGVDERADQHSSEFFSAMLDLGQAQQRSVRVRWVIDDKRDGLESLTRFLDRHPGIHVDVVCNLYFAPKTAFDLFESSNVRRKVLDCGGRIVDLPALANRVARIALIKRLSHAQIARELGILERREYAAWWQLARANYRSAGVLP